VERESELLSDTPVRLPRTDREPEHLDAEPRELRNPPRRLLLSVVVGILVVALASFADVRARDHEAEALVTCRHELHNAVVSSDLELMAVAGSIRPTLASTTGARHATVAGVMSVPARHVLPDVLRADRLCRSVSIRPWHFSLKAERDAATSYSAALAAKLREVAADGSAYYGDVGPLRRLRRTADLGVFGGRY
jgi:hypothetical protein